MWLKSNVVIKKVFNFFTTTFVLMNQLEIVDIRDLDRKDLELFMLARDQEKFRSGQVYDWLWKKGITEFDQMTNVPGDLIGLLKKFYFIHPARMEIIQKSVDGTLKAGFRLFDDHFIEGVLIPSGKRTTACISSQSGCPLSCKFCATGKLRNHRNLSAGEIFDQVVLLGSLADREHGSTLSNIVFMGMGEPLLNYDNMLKAIHHITSPGGLGISTQRITLSTVGISERIRQLGDDRVKFNLAISLHSANERKRDAIMPVNRSNPLSSLSPALEYFYDKTQSRITFEYLLMKDFNDGPADARELARFCKIVPCKINLIEYNPIGNDEFYKPSQERVDQFRKFLEEKNLIVNVRKSRGKDIDAACGQLANKIKDKRSK